MSLPLIKPPTDTLYKFLAILGLLFFVSSLIAPIYLTKIVNEQEIELGRDLKVLVLNAKEWESRYKDLEEISNQRREAHKWLEEVSHDYITGKRPETELASRFMRVSFEVREKERPQIISRLGPCQ